MLDFLEIRKAHAAGESIRSIALRLGHCQKSVVRAIRSQTGEPLPYTRTKPVGYPKLGAFVAIIQHILREDESAPRKQRHHAKRIFERLKAEHGYAGSYYPVRRYVASLRQSTRETFMRLDHLPGRRMEFDFGQYIRVLQLLMRHPATRLDRVIGLLIHKPTVAAELIAQAADHLAGAEIT